MEYKIGTRVDHEKYGVGIISENTFSQVKIIFIRGGEVQFSKSNLVLDIISTPDEDDSVASNMLSLEEVEKAIEGVLNKHNSLSQIIPLGEKWDGGTMLLQPANKSLKPKEIPVEAFFHKIVMVRDRLRVLEQNINSNTKLSDEEKINLQQYITRIYGSLTTFNILFDDKEYYFVGQKGE